jgi:hypothetical protein
VLGVVAPFPSSPLVKRVDNYWEWGVIETWEEVRGKGEVSEGESKSVSLSGLAGLAGGGRGGGEECQMWIDGESFHVFVGCNSIHSSALLSYHFQPSIVCAHISVSLLACLLACQRNKMKKSASCI